MNLNNRKVVVVVTKPALRNSEEKRTQGRVLIVSVKRETIRKKEMGANQTRRPRHQTTTGLPPGRGAGRAGGVAVAAAAATAAVTTTVTTAGTTAVGGGTTHAAAATVGGSSAVGATAAEGRGSTTHATAEATNITGSVGTTTATAATTATTATIAAALTGNTLQESGNLLVSLLQEVEQVTDNTTVATVEESSGDTSVTGTTGTTDTVDIVINVSGQIVVDNVSDVGDIQTTGSNGGSDQDWAAAVTEQLQSTLTLTLGAVTVNGGGREALVDEEVGQRVGHALGLDEDQGETAGSVGVEDIQQDGALVHVLDVLDLLSNVLRGRTDTANRQENVILQEVTGQHLDITRESGREHECLALVNGRHVLTLDNAANLGLETHVQHAISLIENEVLDVLERDTATLNQVDETTGGSNEQIAATLDLAQLRANVGTTVHDTGADPRAVGELAGLVEDLRDQLTSGSKNERGGVGLALAAVAKLATALGRSSGGAILESLGEDGEEETTGFTGTGLSARHQIAAAHDNRDRVLLDGSRGDIAGETNVGDKVVIQRGVGERSDGLGDILAGCLNGDVVVVGEVDTGVLLIRVVGDTEELTLNASVDGAGDVLAVAPLAITRATGLRSTTTASTSTAAVTCVTGISVSIWVEWPDFSLGDPAGITIGRAARAEVGGVSVRPVATARTASRETIWG